MFCSCLRHIEYKSEGSEKLSIEQYFEKIKPYLDNMIDKLIKSGKWKINLTTKINFLSSKGNDDKQSNAFREQNRWNY